MPRRAVHRKLDLLLFERGVITEDGYRTVADRVHDMMDGGVERYGPHHQRLDKAHDPKYVRAHVSKFSAKSRLQTDAIRVSHGHMVLDELHRAHCDLAQETLLEKAWLELNEQGHVRCRARKRRRRRPRWRRFIDDNAPSALSSAFNSLLG